MKLQDIPIVVSSGEKFVKENGIVAIKNGIKRSQEAPALPTSPKPKWLKAPAPTGEKFFAVKKLVHDFKLSTVCEEAMCPNIGECWNAGTATIMLMGSTCTRACRFCAVDTGNPRGILDPNEAAHTAKAVQIMGLNYVVLTSVNRDDLPDGGAGHYAQVVCEVKKVNPNTAVEALTPDFKGCHEDVATVVNSGIEVFAQNVETVKRLTHPVRDPRASYEQTLSVLAFAKTVRSDVLTKTSLILGLGETDEEILETMRDLRKANVDILTLGQYLRPTLNHLPVERFVTPEEFAKYREWGLAEGFTECISGPMVRSSYRAEQALQKNNVGLNAQTGG
jgi:lipoic acid synthetase